MTNPDINPPDVQAIVSPILSALPAAAMSPEPAPATLQLLTPILRQKVQVLKSSGPWLGLLQSSSTTDKTRLSEIARSSKLEPHPVSGEIEVDWDRDVQVRFRRLDQETLQGLVVLKELDLFFRLVFCASGEEGPGEGWKVGEVGVAKKPDGSLCELDSFCGYHSVSTAEKEFGDEAKKVSPANPTDGKATQALYDAQAPDDADDDDDDDDEGYWDRYDATPARTPAAKRSPAPQSMQRATGQSPYNGGSAAEAEYFSRYDSVQPALDNHDPDEEVHVQAAAPSLGLGSHTNHIHAPVPAPRLGMAAGLATVDSPESSVGTNIGSPETANGRKLSLSTHSSPPSYTQAAEENGDAKQTAALLHPRPASAASSKGSDSVARLEEAAENFGVKQHISRSIKSLFQLSRASGMDRDEFEALVKRELDVLGMMAEDDY